MEAAAPTPGHAKLQALAGDWRIAVQSFSAGVCQPGKARARSRMALGGRFLISDYVEDSGFCGHGVYGYDAAQQRYSMHWFDTHSPGPPAQTIWGDWQDDRLCFRKDSPSEAARYTYTIQTPEHFRFELETSSDGLSWRPLLVADYHREATSSPDGSSPQEQGRT